MVIYACIVEILEILLCMQNQTIRIYVCIYIVYVTYVYYTYSIHVCMHVLFMEIQNGVMDNESGCGEGQMR